MSKLIDTIALIAWKPRKVSIKNADKFSTQQMYTNHEKCMQNSSLVHKFALNIRRFLYHSRDALEVVGRSEA